MKRLLMLAPVLMVAACVETQPPATIEPAPDACKASSFQGLIGQPAAAVEKMKFPEGTRILRPNMAVTADYRVDRLNVEIGNSGKVEKVSCY
ncbi:I78 family peptidase inhibitor [Paracoccus sp. (in: a-proteobacteria)]|uniref:I78 family peptidase inhibitor n=1 Tax=Paracoccus sp. TaxID=267 RepID=UPI0028971F20|nr:I78 family peptidase inhibitor [Paracoccus sp. (in: a-proteobacteria)]